MALLPLALGGARAQVRHLDAGTSEPSALFVDRSSGRLNLLTAGLDRNFNGAFDPDSGDVLPRWLVIDPSSERVVDSLVFGAFFSSFPIRVGVDQAGHRLFVPMGGRISSYDIAALKPLRDTFALGAYAAVSYDSLGKRVIASARPGFTYPGYTVTFDAATGDTLMIVGTGVNPGMSISDWNMNTNGPEQYTLVEGSFTSASSQIAYSALQPDVFTGDNLGGLGGGGVPRAACSGGRVAGRARGRRAFPRNAARRRGRGAGTPRVRGDARGRPRRGSDVSARG